VPGICGRRKAQIKQPLVAPENLKWAAISMEKLEFERARGPHFHCYFPRICCRLVKEVEDFYVYNSRSPKWIALSPLNRHSFIIDNT
jgi:hypothetical protein